MNASNAKDYLPLVQALADGKQIQMKHPSGEWLDAESVSGVYAASYYRIKPEPPKPREYWISREPICSTHPYSFSVFERPPNDILPYPVIHVREVIE